MCQQNLPKLWCRYEFIVHNHLWNSEIVPQWIQQKISRKVTETDSQKLEFDNCKQQLFTLTMCLPACLWDHIAGSPSLIARSQLGRFLQNVMTINFRYWFFSFQHRKYLSCSKHVHHNPSIRYASRCQAKRKWLHVLWDRPFLEVRTNRVESMIT